MLFRKHFMILCTLFITLCTIDTSACFSTQLPIDISFFRLQTSISNRVSATGETAINVTNIGKQPFQLKVSYGLLLKKTKVKYQISPLTTHKIPLKLDPYNYRIVIKCKPKGTGHCNGNLTWT